MCLLASWVLEARSIFLSLHVRFRTQTHPCLPSSETLSAVTSFLTRFFFPRLDEQKKIMIMICCVILAIILASTIGGIFA